MKIGFNIPLEVGTVITVDDHPFELVEIDENVRTWRSTCVGCGKTTTHRTGQKFYTRYTCDEHKGTKLRSLKALRRRLAK